ncbi:MAG: hypothetical protein JSV66_01140 [Trueperaceae bacterium]|nr:MAG: hypothetical protein JSV66_01140 [Trueperaceae bacterium]
MDSVSPSEPVNLVLGYANVDIIALNRLRDLGLIEDSGAVRARIGAHSRALVRPGSDRDA